MYPRDVVASMYVIVNTLYKSNNNNNNNKYMWRTEEVIHTVDHQTQRLQME
jgi:hypothetical protein